MRFKRLAGAVTIAAMASVLSGRSSAQDLDDGGAITARVHGTFQDKSGGLGVLSGDMMVSRFEVRNGTLTAMGTIVGALADSGGNVLGHVKHELALPVANVVSTCNQLRMDLSGADAEVLNTLVRFDPQVAGFDSRDGVIPRALRLLCETGQMLQGKPEPSAIAAALNRVVAAIRPATVK